MNRKNDRLISIEELSLLLGKNEDDLFELIFRENLPVEQVEGKNFAIRKDICNLILDHRISSECILSNGSKVLLEPVRLIKTDEEVFFFYVSFPDTDEGAFFEVHLARDLYVENADLIYVYSRLKEALSEKESLTSSYVVISSNQVIFNEIVPEVDL